MACRHMSREIVDLVGPGTAFLVSDCFTSLLQSDNQIYIYIFFWNFWISTYLNTCAYMYVYIYISCTCKMTGVYC